MSYRNCTLNNSVKLVVYKQFTSACAQYSGSKNELQCSLKINNLIFKILVYTLKTLKNSEITRLVT